MLTRNREAATGAPVISGIEIHSFLFEIAGLRTTRLFESHNGQLSSIVALTAVASTAAGGATPT